MLQDAVVSNALAITIGAVPGALSRYYITEWCKKIFGKNFPYGTFFYQYQWLLDDGFFITLISVNQNFPDELQLLIATVFLGAYTTFSTDELETFTQLQKSHLTVAVLYWAGSAIVSLIAIQLGVVLAKFNKSTERKP